MGDGFEALWRGVEENPCDWDRLGVLADWLEEYHPKHPLAFGVRWLAVRKRWPRRYAGSGKWYFDCPPLLARTKVRHHHLPLPLALAMGRFILDKDLALLIRELSYRLDRMRDAVSLCPPDA